MIQEFSNAAAFVDYDLRPQQAAALTLLLNLVVFILLIIMKLRKSESSKYRRHMVITLILFVVAVVSGLYIGISYGTIDLSIHPLAVHFFLKGQTCPGVGLFTEHLWFWPIFFGIPLLNILLARLRTLRPTMIQPT